MFVPFDAPLGKYLLISPYMWMWKYAFRTPFITMNFGIYDRVKNDLGHSHIPNELLEFSCDERDNGVKSDITCQIGQLAFVPFLTLEECLSITYETLH